MAPLLGENTHTGTSCGQQPPPSLGAQQSLPGSQQPFLAWRSGSGQQVQPGSQHHLGPGGGQQTLSGWHVAHLPSRHEEQRDAGPQSSALGRS